MKKIIMFITMMIVGISLFILSFNLTLKNIITKAVTSTFTSTYISDKVGKIIFEKTSDLTKSEQDIIKNEIENSSEMNEITSIYLNTLVSDILDNKNSTVDITPQVNSLTDRVLDKYSLPIVIKDNIKSRIKSMNFNNMYTMILDMVKDKSKVSTPIIEIYNLIISEKTTIILFISIIIGIIISILLNVKLSIKYISFSFEIATILLLISIIIINKNCAKITHGLFRTPIDIDVNPFIIIATIYLVITIILKIIYKIVDKKTKK